MSILKGEAGCLFDATKCRVKPAERPATDGRAGLISHGWRDVRARLAVRNAGVTAWDETLYLAGN
jgi:hypothetical protein